MSAHGPSQLQLCTCCNASCVLVTQEEAADVLANVKKLEKYDKVKHTTFFSERRQGGDAKTICDYIRHKEIWFGYFPCCQWAPFMPGVKIRQQEAGSDKSQIIEAGSDNSQG